MQLTSLPQWFDPVETTKIRKRKVEIQTIRAHTDNRNRHTNKREPVCPHTPCLQSLTCYIRNSQKDTHSHRKTTLSVFYCMHILNLGSKVRITATWNVLVQTSQFSKWFHGILIITFCKTLDYPGFHDQIFMTFSIPLNHSPLYLVFTKLLLQLYCLSALTLTHQRSSNLKMKQEEIQIK